VLLVLEGQVGGLGAAVREPLPVVFASEVLLGGSLVCVALADVGEVFENEG
jgi:hypothetical protein